MINIKGFLKHNDDKMLTIQVWLLAAKYRFMIKHFESNKLKDHFGIRGEESDLTATDEQIEYCKVIKVYVNRSASNTPWESKCLVRALTAQTLLKRKGIPSTMYLGVGKENDKMIAHAWIRVGSYYVTGGNGKGYAIVDRFRA